MSAKKKSPLRQLTLNFGQKSPKLINCKECGMIYNQSDKQDEQIHSKHHQEKEKVLNYVPFKPEKILNEYIDGKCVVVQWGIDSKQTINKAIRILEFVDSQLGIEEKNTLNKSSELSDSLNSPFEVLKQNIKNLSKFYFFVSYPNKKIDGFCLAEPIDQAYKIKYLNERKNTFTFDNSQIEKAFCGITRIWVSPNARRKGIASKLLDSVCENFLYIRRLDPNQLAFSDPTELGQCLAKSYTKSDCFLVYNNCTSNQN